MNELFTKTPNPQYGENVSRLISWGHWFLCFNILLAMLIALRFILAMPWPTTGLGQFYLLVSWIGHFAFIGFIFFLLTIFPLTFVCTHQRLLRSLSILIATSVQTLLLIDTQVYQLLKFHLNPFVWSLLFEPFQSKTNLNWNFLFIAIPTIVLLEIIFSNQAWKRQFKRSRPYLGKGVAALFLSCFLLTHLTHIWADARFYTPITAQKSNFPLSYPMTARSFLARHGWLDLQEFKAREKNTVEQPHRRLLYPLAPLQVLPHEQKLNLLLIVLSGLRQDMLNNINMPNLQRFSQQYQRFDNHVAGDNETETSLFSLFYGLPAQYADDVIADKRPPLLIDELQRQEYRIKTFTTDGLNQPIYQNAIFSGIRHKQQIGVGKSDDQTLQAWLSWQQKQLPGSPWFSYLALSGPGTLALPADFHGPYQPELKQLDPFGSIPAAQQPLLVNRYKNAVFYMDQLLGNYFEQLMTHQVLDNTLVIITSDHGFELGESGPANWGAGGNYSNVQMKVPLIMAWPGHANQQIHALTSHQDLVPTLLPELLGVTSPEADYSTGHSLLQPPSREWVISGNNRHSVIFGQQEITLFDRQGNFEVRTVDGYKSIDNGRQDMPVLLKVMRDLSRFKGTMDNSATAH
jgi:membrane-anchored protein YejM (alkaline phosphatase superfamily)